MAETHAPDPLMPTSAAAPYCGLAAQTLRTKRCKGGGPVFVVLSRNRIAYRRRDLDEWISSRVATNTTDARLRGLTGPAGCAA
jgi:hypothetical protein